MNGKDMFRGMEYVGDDLIEEAERCQFRQPQRRIHSPLLVAAMIALMLFLMGCAVAFVLRMSNLKIGAGTAEQDYSLVDGVYVKDPHTITTTTLTLAGLEGSDTYKACAALYAYGEKYKADNADWTGYSDAMHARAQELAEQYGLKPEGRLLNFRTVRHLCDALGIERFTNNDPAISADIDSGRCYDTGNFQLEMTFRFPENSGDNITCVRGGLRWNRKDCFSADYVTLVDNGDWVERNYTTMSGNTVLILRSPSQEQGYILCDREEALMTLWLDVNLEVYSEVGGVVSVERLNMTDEQLEKVADTIDFAISPQTPTQADVDAQANFFHSATQNGYTVQLKSVETDGYVAQIRLGITAPADVDIEGLDVRIGDNSFTTAGRQLNRYSGGFDAVADGDGQSNTKDFLGEFCISFLDGLRPFALGDAWNLQIADLYADSGTSSTQVLAAGEWQFSVTFDETNTDYRELELLNGPITAQAMTGWRADGTDVIEKFSIASFKLRKFSSEIVRDTAGENEEQCAEPSVDFYSWRDHFTYAVMKDGTKIQLLEDRNCNAVDLTQVDYVLLADGTKLTVPET